MTYREAQTSTVDAPESGHQDVAILVGGVAVIVFLFALATWTEAKQRRGIYRGFRRAGAWDASFERGASVVGTVRERIVRYRLMPGLEDDPGESVVVIDAPEGMPPFEMHLFPQTWLERRRIAAGVEIDVATGDAAFDQRVVVEASPAEVAREILDPELRASILALMPCDIDVEGGRLTLTLPGEIIQPERVRTSIETMARLCNALATATIPSAEGNGAPARAARRAAKAAVAGLRRTRAWRGRRRTLMFVAAIAVVFGLARLARRRSAPPPRNVPVATFAHAPAVVSVAPAPSSRSIPRKETEASALEILTEDKSHFRETQPAPSPDGRRLLFTRTDRATPGASTLVLRTLSDHHDELVATDAERPRWIGEGAIAYVRRSSVDAGAPPILEVSAKPPFARVATLSGESLSDASADGKLLAIVSAQGVTLSPMDPRAAAIVVRDARARVAFSRDGRSIAYWRDGHDLAVRALGGGPPRDLVETSVPDFAWSPDARWIAYCEGERIALIRVEDPRIVTLADVHCGGLDWASDGWLYDAEPKPGRLVRLRVDPHELE